MSNDNDFLNREGFGSEEKVLYPDPKNNDNYGQPIEITLDDLSAYALNPRKAPNPKFEMIKQTLKVSGLDAPLAITKRPGEAGYTLYKGGNTRLKALRELYQETGDNRFFYIKCYVKPWPGDMEVLTNHMVENDTQGQMTLVDKANAVYKIKKLYEDEAGKILGLRPLEQLLKTKGWEVSFVNIGVFIFTAEKLVDHIPLALHAGMGTPKVKQLRKTYNAIKKYIEAKLPDLNAEEIQKQYLSNLAHYDSEEDLGDGYALNDTCRYIGEQYNLEASRVQFEIDHILRTGELYDGGSTSAEFNDLGQRVNNHNDADDEDKQSETKTSETESPLSTTETTPPKTVAAGSTLGTEGQNDQQPSNDSVDPINKTATGSTIHLSPQAQRQAQIIEMGHQVRNKVKAMLIKYHNLGFGKYLSEQESYPFFTSSDAEMLILRVDILEKSDDWDNKMLALACEMVPFFTAYFEAKVNDLKNSDTPRERLNLEENALNTCTSVLREEIAEAERVFGTIRYGFAYFDENMSEVLGVQKDFSDLGQLLQTYRATVQQSGVSDEGS